MKMYTEATSERATKGQGGNNKIVINLMLENSFEIGNLVFTCTTYPKNNDVYELTYYPINENCQNQKINSGKITLYKTKGKKQ